MRAFTILLAAFAAIMVNEAHAAGLFSPMGVDSASVMPKGIRSFRLAGFTSEIQDKYDASGSVQPLANSFNKPFTWNKLINSRPDAGERGYLRGGLQSEGINLDSPIGDSAGLVNARLTSFVPVFAYGITDKVTLGMGLPIVYSRTHVATGSSFNATGQANLNTIMASGNGARVASYSGLLANVVNTQIAAYGYKPLESEEHTDIGDLTMGLKILVLQKSKFALVLAPKVVAPTGREADVDKVIDLAPGGGIWQTGLSTIGEYTATSKWSLVSSAGYTHQWVADKAVRIPRTGDESISPDVDHRVHKKLGDIMGVAAGTKYKFTPLLTGSLGYSLQYKEQDRYEGGKYTPERYGYLEQNTWQNMQSVVASISMSTIPLFQQKKFAIPGDASFSLASVIEGRNVSNATLAIFELAAYF